MGSLLTEKVAQAALTVPYNPQGTTPSTVRTNR